MNYGYFDEQNREYVITRPDVPQSWTNYLGVEKFTTAISHNAGGYSFYATPQYHRITRFRANAVPMDRPGHYVYIRDDDTGEYWSLSWQPVGKDFTKAKYECRHGLSYSKFSCDYNGIDGTQTLFIPLGEACEIWNVDLTNKSDKKRNLSVFAYCEFSYHHIDMDNQNFQMSLYSAGAKCENNVIEYDLFYEETGFQYFTSTVDTDGFDCKRDEFLGLYHTETNPKAVEEGKCFGSFGTTGNHCGAFVKKITLDAGQDTTLAFILGEGGQSEGERVRAKYAKDGAIDAARKELADWWIKRLSNLQISTPHNEMNLLINTWTIYQAEVNVLFSRFASFIEVGGRTGLGYRDTAQDAMCITACEPAACYNRLIQLLHGQVSLGYGLHLFQPEWFMPKEAQQSFKSPTVVPSPDKNSMIHGIDDVCSDDALWLVASVCEYVRETGDVKFFDLEIPYADKGKGTVYEHIRVALDFTATHMGQHGVAQGLRADWNDCLNLGGGESAMVSFLFYWALEYFVEAAKYLGKTEDVEKYSKYMVETKELCEKVLWDGKWYLRGFTAQGKPIGTDADKDGKVHMESNTWAVVSGVAAPERAVQTMDSVHEYLLTDFGLKLNAPSFFTPDDSIGFVTRVYPGVKENGAVFSHPNPWAWVAETKLGRGNEAVKLYDSLCPALQNDKIEVRKAEPYSYCQFVYGDEHPLHGQANHPWMTGTAGWAYFAVTHYILGMRPQYESFEVDPCIPSDWKDLSISRTWRGATFNIKIENPNGVQKGVKEIYVNGTKVDKIAVQAAGSTVDVRVVMG